MDSRKRVRSVRFEIVEISLKSLLLSRGSRARNVPKKGLRKAGCGRRGQASPSLPATRDEHRHINRSRGEAGGPPCPGMTSRKQVRTGKSTTRKQVRGGN
jgi:hypothetical protein